MYLSQPKNPIRDVLKAMTGRAAPSFVRGYTCDGLSDAQWDILQSWSVNNCRPFYLTGMGLLDAAQQQVDEAVSNGNIPPPPEKPPASRMKFLLVQLEALISRRTYLLEELHKATTELAHMPMRGTGKLCIPKTATRKEPGP